MTVSLYSTDIAELAMYRTYSDAPTDYEEWCFYLNHAIGNGFYKEINFGDIHIGYGNIALAQKTLLNFENDYETVEMHFALNGYGAVHSKDLSKSIQFSPNRHNISYTNNITGVMEWQEKGWQTFEVHLRPVFFKKYLPKDNQVFELFKKHIDSGCPALINEQNRFISQQMYQIIHDIIHCERKGMFKKMLVEAKVIELLLLQLEQLGETDLVNTTLKKSDIEKLYAVRDFILSHLTQSCSLIDLSQKVGTNEFTLKKGFKELFGTTVFGFWNNAKMEEARKMLQTQAMSVGEVAEAVGYKGPQHFATAFKRKFGLLPSEFKS